MRYCIQPATTTDVAVFSMAIDPDSNEWGNGEETEQVDRLLNTCAASTQVWAVHDKSGVPRALWGVSPKPDDHEVGCTWLLASEELDETPGDFRALSRLVLTEMFSQYTRLENLVSAQKDRAIELLRSLGFAVEPAVLDPRTGTVCHRVWLEPGESAAQQTQLLN